jgi:hypothetical protein
MAHPKGSSVTLPRNRWPEALRDFLIGRSTVTVEDVERRRGPKASIPSH